MLQQNERRSGLPVQLTSSEMVERLPAEFMALLGFPYGVGTYVEVWGVAQRRRCLRGMLSLHGEMLVSPNTTNEAA